MDQNQNFDLNSIMNLIQNSQFQNIISQQMHNSHSPQVQNLSIFLQTPSQPHSYPVSMLPNSIESITSTQLPEFSTQQGLDNIDVQTYTTTRTRKRHTCNKKKSSWLDN